MKTGFGKDKNQTMLIVGMIIAIIAVSGLYILGLLN